MHRRNLHELPASNARANRTRRDRSRAPHHPGASVPQRYSDRLWCAFANDTFDTCMQHNRRVVAEKKNNSNNNCKFLSSCKQKENEKKKWIRKKLSRWHMTTLVAVVAGRQADKCVYMVHCATCNSNTPRL